jgi:hypothetical protein
VIKARRLDIMTPMLEAILSKVTARTAPDCVPPGCDDAPAAGNSPIKVRTSGSVRLLPAMAIVGSSRIRQQQAPRLQSESSQTRRPATERRSIMSPRSPAIATVLAVLVASRAGAQSAADPRDLRRWDFTLENVRYEILLPPHATVRSGANEFSAWLSSRLMRSLDLRPASRGSDRAYDHEERLGNGAVVKYSIERESGGSGGPEALLQGVLRMGTHVLAVSCHDQIELATPSPEWCLRFLGYLRIAEGG